MPPELALRAPALTDTWRAALMRLALAVTAIVAMTWPAWAEMVRQWWDSSTYNHILLIPAILAWLVWQRGPQLAQLTPRAWPLAFAWLALGAALWASGTILAINTFAQAGAVVMLQGAVAAVLGVRVAAGLLFPLAYMAFLVPFGDEIVPALQAITAKLAIALTHWSGVPARIDGVFIDTPVGLFKVAEACSGVKFLVAMVALGTLVAQVCFKSWNRRAALILAAVVVPIVANGVRAWGTIYIAQSQGVAFAEGFDHIVYGWVFFAVVMALVLGVAWRFFDRAPDEPLIDAAALDASPLLARLAGDR